MGNFSKRMKRILKSEIAEMCKSPSLYAKNPETDFKRNRRIPLTDLIDILLSCGGNSLNKELYEYYKEDELVTTSAFVQQRDKLKPEALEHLLHSFNAACSNVDNKLLYGYRLLAVDGSDVAYNGYHDDDTRMHYKHKDTNQFHINALYDLCNKTYTDVIMQTKMTADEPKAAWEMMERQNFRKCLLIGDRGYASANLIAHINRIPGADYLIRIKENQWNVHNPGSFDRGKALKTLKFQ